MFADIPTKVVKGGFDVNINSITVEKILAEKLMTRTQLAEKSGISRQNISTIIRRGSCSAVSAGKLALGLGVSVSTIIDGV